MNEGAALLDNIFLVEELRINRHVAEEAALISLVIDGNSSIVIIFGDGAERRSDWAILRSIVSVDRSRRLERIIDIGRFLIDGNFLGA